MPTGHAQPGEELTSSVGGFLVEVVEAGYELAVGALNGIRLAECGLQPMMRRYNSSAETGAITCSREDQGRVELVGLPNPAMLAALPHRIHDRLTRGRCWDPTYEHASRALQVEGPTIPL